MAETGAAKQTVPLPVPITIKKDTVDPISLTVRPNTRIEFHNESSIDRIIQFDGLSPVALFFSPGTKATLLAVADGRCVYNGGLGTAPDDGPYQVIVDGNMPGGDR